jgi:hypothetical protein
MVQFFVSSQELGLQGDAYNQTGCYNLNQGCPAGSPGFVQVSNKVLIGGSISPTSTTDSTQYEFKLLVFKVTSDQTHCCCHLIFTQRTAALAVVVNKLLPVAELSLGGSGTCNGETG